MIALSFPNCARSCDEARARIRFLGHDGMFEVRFYVLATAGTFTSTTFNTAGHGYGRGPGGEHYQRQRAVTHQSI